MSDRIWRWCLVPVLLLCVHSSTTVAGELLQGRVELRDGHYLIHLDMRIDAKSAAVYRALLDFKHLPDINDSIKSAKQLSQNGREHTVAIVAEGCVWFFCRRVKQRQVVTELDGGYLMSLTDPEHSDFRYGRALWHIVDEGKTTRVTYNGDFVPAFWVPPLIGTAIFKRQLLKQGQKTINGIERYLRDHPP